MKDAPVQVCPPKRAIVAAGVESVGVGGVEAQVTDRLTVGHKAVNTIVGARPQVLKQNQHSRYRKTYISHCASKNGALTYTI